MIFPPPRPPFTYELQHGSYYFYGATGKLSFMADRVSFAFDVDSGTVFQHGPAEKVEDWARNARARLRSVGPAETPAFTIATVTFAPGLPPEELTRFVSTAGYLARYLEQHGYRPQLYPESPAP